jgi:hypothetical protein
MDSVQQYREFKRTIEDLKRAARLDYERRIRALDAALAAAEGIGMHPEPTDADAPFESTPSRTNEASRPFVLKDEVRQAIRELRSETFTQRDITDNIRMRHPESTVYPGSVFSALKKLAQSGEVELVKEARGGSDPTIYREVAVSP